MKKNLSTLLATLAILFFCSGEIMAQGFTLTLYNIGGRYSCSNLPNSGNQCMIFDVRDNIPNEYFPQATYQWSYTYNVNDGRPNTTTPIESEELTFDEITTRGVPGHEGITNKRMTKLTFPKSTTRNILLTCTVTVGNQTQSISTIVYPGTYSPASNPVNNVLEIINNSPAQATPMGLNSNSSNQCTAALFSQNGLVRQINISPEEHSSYIQTADLQNGIYYLVIKNGDITVDSHKIIIQH